MKTYTILLFAVLSQVAIADDVGGGSNAGSSGSSSTGSATDTWAITTAGGLSESRKLISKGKFRAAIQTLNQVVQADHKNADAWNLLGYSQRKLGKLKRSGKYYAKALKLDPEHKGALEYQGQLFVTLNELERAKENQRKLAILCPEGCEQLDKLTQAINSAES